MALSNRTNTGITQDAPTYKLSINEVQLEETTPVLGITILRSFNKITTAKIIIKDGKTGGGSKKKADFPIQNKATFVPGNKISIEIGHRGSNDYTAFSGIITGLEVRIRKGSSRLLVTCKSEAFRMTLQSKSRYYSDSTDGEIISSLLHAYNLTYEVQDKLLKDKPSKKEKSLKGKHDEMVQYEATDWAFLLSRAEENGLFVHIDESDQVIVEPLNFSKEAVDILAYGDNIYELDARIDARLQFEGTKVQAWDFNQQAVVEQEATPPTVVKPGNNSGTIPTEQETTRLTVSEPGNITAATLAEVGDDGSRTFRHSGYKLNGQLQAKANALLMRDRLAKIVGRARIKTTQKITPGDLIDLRNIGEQFSGVALVSGVRYELSRESWMVDVQFGFPNRWKLEQSVENNKSAVGAFVPPVSGLQIGLVTKIHEDPEEANRIKVRLPLLDINEEGVWARLATLDAGQNRGSFFMPEVDDEVIVGFIQDDPNDAVVLGMLHSAAKPSPLTAEEENKQKGFFSREGVKIVFDEEQKALTIETPGGNKLILSDEEKKIALETSGGTKLVLSDEEKTATLQTADGNKLEVNENSGLTLGTSSKPTKILGNPIDLN